MNFKISLNLLLGRSTSILLEKMSYKFKYWLLYSYISIKAFPKLIKFMFIDFSELSMMGSSVSLETSSMCQLSCPICPTSKGINKKGIVGWGHLRFIDFKNFINNNPYIKNIELSKWGEIFLNPELKQIIKYAYIKKINLTAYTGVNLNNVKEDILESLVKYKFKLITISLDGATDEIYKIYRRGGDFNKVIENIKIINFYKKRYHSEFPKMVWQFIIMGHNEHELPTARKLAKNLGMIFYSKLNENTFFSPIKDKDFVRKECKLGVASREEFFQKYKKLYLQNICSMMWTSPQINWDGKLLGCGENIWIDFGNVFKTGLKQCLNNKLYVYTKQVVLGKIKAKKDIPCLKCHNYKFIRKIPLRKRDIILNLP